MGFQHFRTKDFWILRAARAQSFHQQAPQRATQPVMRRDIETKLGPVQDRMRQLVFHQLLENHLLPRARNLQ